MEDPNVLGKPAQDEPEPAQDAPAPEPAQEPPEPDLEAKLQAIEKEKEELRKKMESTAAANEAQIQQLQQIVTAAFSTPQQPQPEADSDVEYDPLDPQKQVKAIEQIAARKVKQAAEPVTTALMGLYADNVKGRMELLKAKEPDLWEKVGDKVEKFFEENPNAVVRGAAAVDQIFDYYTGQFYRENRQSLTSRGTRVTPPMTPSATPAAPVKAPKPEPQPTEPELTPTEAKVAAAWGVSPEQYVAIRDGKSDVPKHRGATSLFSNPENKRRLW